MTIEAKDFHARIRQATRHLHSELEALPALEAIVNQTSPRAYAVFLLTFHRLIVSLGASLIPGELWPAQEYGYAHGLELIEHDRLILAQSTILPQLPLRPSIETVEQFWGLSYVIEGSSLGGAALLSQWQTKQDWPISFLQRSGPSGPRWVKFLGQLEAMAKVLDADAIVSEAESAFLYFISSMASFIPDQPIRQQGESHYGQRY